MESKFGIPFAVWDQAKEDIRRILVGCARLPDPTIAYSDLVSRVNAVHMEPDSHALAAMLGEISTEEDEAGFGMLSVLVVHKDGDKMPGPGFFELAGRLGRDASDKEKCWVEELRKVITSNKNRQL